MARDLDRMKAGLRGYLAGGERLTNIVPLSTGHSNETYLLEGVDRVLRMPPSEEGLLPPYDMPRQHAILDAVGRSPGGPPVPRVFELCDDASVIGDPFFVMGRLPGEAFEYKVPDWLATAPPATRGNVCEQWIGAVTALHRLPASTIGDEPKTPRAEAEHWRAFAIRAEAPQRLIDVLDDLVAKPPGISGPPTPVHGDPKHGNCLWDRDRLVALLDWEMAHVGDPLTDLGYLLQFYDQGEAALASAGFELEGWWPRQKTIDEWEKATGRSSRGVDTYEVLGIAKICAIIAVGHHLFRSGRTKDPRFEAWGAVVPRYVDFAVERASLA